jgi:hypothetical protein
VKNLSPNLTLHYYGVATMCDWCRNLFKLAIKVSANTGHSIVCLYMCLSILFYFPFNQLGRCFLDHTSYQYQFLKKIDPLVINFSVQVNLTLNYQFIQ